MLSRAGKEVLIKAVARSIPMYTMGVFLIPVKLCNELNSMCARFWWGQVGDERKIHWKSWIALSQPKKEGGMGFRDLGDFNLAMLAKQGWRLIQDQSSLLYSCLKARYFPRTSFLEAFDTPNSSYTWKSLLATQQILKTGCCWRVGNGSSIRVTRDKWIPNYPSNKVLHPPVEDEWEWRVAELIDWERHNWDGELIRSRFHREDAEAIIRIPLSRRYVMDKMYWLHHKTGAYTVRSGYHVARILSREKTGVGECSRPPRGSHLWAKLWKLHVPNKIKIFGWKVCQNILPTKDALFRRKITEDGGCEVCKGETESVLHMLWECRVAQDVWAGCSGKLQKSVLGHWDVMQLFEDMMDRLPTEDMELFLVQGWVIWNQRNSILHGGQVQDPAKLNQRAKNLLEDFRNAQDRLVIGTITDGGSATWKPPSGLVYKLNFDAAVAPSLRTSGFGAIIRNEKGEVMAAYAGRGPSVTDSEEAEALACRKAIEFAVDTSFSDLIIEGDNIEVIKAISSARDNGSRLGHIYEDIRCLAASLRDWSTSWVRRNANTVAHSLSQFAREIENEIVWLEDSPPPTLEALYSDSLFL